MVEGEQLKPDAWPIPRSEVAGDRGGALAWIEYAALRASLELGSRLPRGAQDGLARALARVARLVDRRHTQSARKYIAQALPSASENEREELVLGAWRHLIALALEDARFNQRVLGPRLLEHYDVKMHDDVRRAFANGGGLAITAHVGNWEALPTLLVALGARPLYAVSRPARNRPLSLFAQATREARGYRLLHRHGAADEIRAIVGARGWVGLLLDQRARGKKAVLAPFFGRLAHSERGVAVLARRLRAPLVFAACYRAREPFRYRAVLPRVIWPDELAGREPEAIAALINRELEQLILAEPAQYFWLHDRYYKAPEPAGVAQ